MEKVVRKVITSIPSPSLQGISEFDPAKVETQMEAEVSSDVKATRKANSQRPEKGEREMPKA